MRERAATKEQIVQLMAEGWKLYHSTEFGVSSWLRNTGSGHRRVNSASFDSLRKAGRILRHSALDWHTDIYVLAPAEPGGQR